MSLSYPQLPLHIGLRDNATFANFYPGRNAELLYLLEQGNEPFVYIWGPPGSGKTHLLQAACQRVGSAAVYLPLDELKATSPEIFEGLEQMRLIAIEGLECIAGDNAWEIGLFHLYNRVREHGGEMLVAAEGSPTALGVVLPDLLSRLTWGPVFRIQSLDDEEKAAALQMRAGARGIHMPQEVAQYLVRHAQRDLHSLFNLLDTLDEASLAAQRRLTIPFVRQLLG